MFRMIVLLSAVMATAELTLQSAEAQTGGSPGIFGNRSTGSTIPNRSSNFGGGGGLGGGTQQAVNSSTLETPGFSVQRQEGGFVGADANDMPQFLRQLQSSVQGTQINANQRNNRGANQNNNRAASSRVVLPRVSYHIAFETPAAQTKQTRETVRTRIDKMFLAKKGIGAADVTFRGQTAILQGTVATDYDRFLAEELVALQPGIARVENQLKVAPLTPPQPPSSP